MQRYKISSNYTNFFRTASTMGEKMKNVPLLTEKHETFFYLKKFSYVTQNLIMFLAAYSHEQAIQISNP